MVYNRIKGERRKKYCKGKIKTKKEKAKNNKIIKIKCEGKVKFTLSINYDKNVTSIQKNIKNTYKNLIFYHISLY